MLEKQIKTLFYLNGLCLLIENLIAILHDIYAVQQLNSLMKIM